MRTHWIPTTLCSALLLCAFSARADRTILSLDGTWQVGESVSATELPAEFTHKAPVPGLANLAEPAFKDVDKFSSRENIANRIRGGLYPESWLTNYWQGKVDQDRNYFWYRREFNAPARQSAARLKINKAQFGTAVWLNGKKLGEYAGCFSASFFDLADAINWRSLFRQEIAWDFDLARARTGNSSAARIAITAMTVSSSISVKPLITDRRLRFRIRQCILKRFISLRARMVIEQPNVHYATSLSKQRLTAADARQLTLG
jgi:hypothetical protein